MSNAQVSTWRNWISRVAVGSALAALVTVGGCSPAAAPQVTVTIKPDKAAAPAENIEGAAPSEGGAPAGGVGDLAGVVLFDGAPTELPPLVAKGAAVRDAEVCAANAIPDETIEVDANSKGIRNVFIYLEKAPAGAKSQPIPEGKLLFDQHGCRFVPHSVLARTTQTLFILNDDSVAHNTHTFPVRNPGFNSVVKVNDREGVPLVYKQSEREPIEVKCDFHPWMRAYHLPLDHSFAALTDENGKFEIKGLPAGTHTFKVWHEKGGLLERAYKVTIKAGQPNEVKLNFGAAKFAAFEGPRPQTLIVNTRP
ncbi:MAG TPA: hypothetical protein VHB77_04400 [Planctomycetaceae bacterium]|nr:hypothetical protein [Planctomycetaceae bacterium]